MRRHLPLALLIFTCLFHLIANLTWLKLDEAPIPWDQAGHTRLAVEFSRFFSGTLHKQTTLLTISSYYPPLTHIIASAFLSTLGFSTDVAALPISLFFVALLIGIYLLVKELYKNEWFAVWTAIFFSFFPVVYENSRWFLLEIPLLTMVVYSWFFLKKSQLLTNWKYIFFFALSVIGVLLTKWIGIVFLIVPLIATWFEITKKRITRTQYTHLFLTGLIIGIATMPWYVVNLKRLLEIGALASSGEITDPQHLLSIQNTFYYLQQFMNFQLGLWPSLAALLSLVLYLINKRALYKKLIIAYLLFGYLVFTFISNKDIRYTIPLLLVFALTLAYCLTAKLAGVKTVHSKTVGVLALCYLVFNYFILSFHLLPTYQRAWRLGVLGWIDYVNTGDIVVHHPRQNTAPNLDILQDILGYQNDHTTSVLVGVDQPLLNPSTLDLEITLNDYWLISLEAPYDKTAFANPQELTRYISRFTYLLVPTGEVGPDAVRHKQALQQIQEYVLHTQPEQFTILKEYDLPDYNQRVLLVKKAT